MPSPFPGMDPYLEGPLWVGFHSQFAIEIARQLTPKLVPRYVALTEKRFVLSSNDLEDSVAVSTTGIRPDVAVASRVDPGVEGAGSATAVAAPIRLETVVPERVPQVSIEIRDTEGRQLITAIELLSPWNKTGEGREEYLSKRRKILASDVHLIEIDLLRAGQRVPMRKPLPRMSYFVLVSRAGERPFMDVWPIGLDEPLPKISVPLRAGDAEVDLELQAAMNGVYDSFGYAYLIDYTRAPTVPLETGELT